ncbi:MAG: GAF domain-containing protein [Anaerolineae bacterium]|nr:GAF domain-containing protein [Anaerolineae bacterium]
MSQRARSDELSALTDIAAQVNCTQDLDEILAGALETTLNVIGEESGEIFLLDQDTGNLILHTHRGVSPAFVAEESIIPLGACLCGQAVATRQLLATTDLENDPLRTRGACLRERFSTCVRLPLMARGRALGLLAVQSRARHAITQADRELLMAIGNQIGIAIANAQLIKDAEQRRATLHSVMNSLVDGLILINRHDRVTYMNPCAEEILALPASTIVGQKLDDLHYQIASQAADPEIKLEQLRLAATCHEEAASVEIALTEPDGRTLQARFFPIRHAGEQSFGLGLILRDVTREREVDEMKSRLLATVSHELRTPLASIKGFATTLLRRDVQWDEASRRDFLSIIDEESDRLSELIGNLLDMSRIEAGELAVEPEPIDLIPLLRETAATLAPLSNNHHLQLELADPLPLVLADARRTRQVLRNLIENAIKYSPEGGSVRVTARADRDRVQVSVADEGIGIEPDQLDRIFDRFYQIDSASTRRVGGTGLGLPISLAIVQAQGGTIWADSQPGAGATFHFTVPRATASPAVAE